MKAKSILKHVDHIDRNSSKKVKRKDVTTGNSQAVTQDFPRGHKQFERDSILFFFKKT